MYESINAQNSHKPFPIIGIVAHEIKCGVQPEYAFVAFLRYTRAPTARVRVYPAAKSRKRLRYYSNQHALHHVVNAIRKHIELTIYIKPV